MSAKPNCRIYIGNLPQDVRQKDLDDLFYKYGKVKYIDLKNRKGPPFAFVEYEDSRDAEDAISGRDGYNFNGYKMRVELQKGNKDRNRYDSRDGGGDRGRNDDRGSFSSGRRAGGPPTRRSDYRCVISGLPPTGSWQDLKDHMREAGNVCYADVFKDGTGVVEFIRYDDMKYAVKNLDDTKFRSHEGETSYIHVKSDCKKGRSTSRSQSRSSTRSRSRSRRREKVVDTERERGSPSYSPVRRSRSRNNDDDEDRHRSKDKSGSHKRRRHSRSRSGGRHHRKAPRGSKSTSRSRSRSNSRKNNDSEKEDHQNGNGDSETNGHENGQDDNNMDEQDQEIVTQEEKASPAVDFDEQVADEEN